MTGTRAGSASGPSSTSHTPSGNRGSSRRAASNANRVLPTPPAPVRVTRRCAVIRSTTVPSEASRPIKSGRCEGRFVRPAGGVTAVSASRMSPVNWYPRPATVLMRSRSAPKTLRSAEIWAWRLFSSTTRSGHTRRISRSLSTMEPRASISAISVSKARPPSSTARPSTSSSRR